MGMIGNYLIVSQPELDELYQGSKSVSAFLYETNQDKIIDIDKAWQGIHFILTGDLFGGDAPLANAVMGGTPIGEEDVGVGPARSLSVSEVAEVAAALQAIDESAFKKRFNIGELTANDIYPNVWEDHDTELEYFTTHYLILRETFLKAARESKAIIVFMN
jgi:hypothetical protein